MLATCGMVFYHPMSAQSKHIIVLPDGASVWHSTDFVGRATGSDGKPSQGGGKPKYLEETPHIKRIDTLDHSSIDHSAT